MSAGIDPQPARSNAPRISLVPLLGATAIMLGITAWPAALSGPGGAADHWAAMALFWAMSAGFVRGVGFIPRQPALRLTLSAAACLLGIGLAVLRLALLHATP